MISIAKGATDPDAFRSATFFYHSAREGMRDLLAHLAPASSAGVLLPAYIGWSPREGSGVYDPVRESGRPADFYALKDDLTVDVSDLARKAATGKFQVLVIIHYFGRVEPAMNEISEIARTHGIILVEDLAHGLYTSLVARVAGGHGDISLYSLHKMLPVPTGGMAVYRNPSIVNGQATTASERAVELASFDLVEIADRRRRNFTVLAEALKSDSQYGRSFELLWPDLAVGEVPQTLPAIISGGRRDDIYEYMNAEGLGMVSLYHTLIPELVQRFPKMHWLSRHIINLPVHQDVSERDLPALADRFLRTLAAHG